MLALSLIDSISNLEIGCLNPIILKTSSAARYVACGFERLDRLPASATKRKCVVGNPVRVPIKQVRDRAYPQLQDGGMINILVTGGSQGTKLFGEVVPEAIIQLSPVMRRRLMVVQQAREDQVDRVKTIYAKAGVECLVQPFFSDMHERLSRAHLVIARSGAGTVTELCVTGRPSILIPLGIAMPIGVGICVPSAAALVTIPC